MLNMPKPSYAWIITADHITEPDDETYAVGVIGPHDAPDELVEAVKKGKGHVFRLYDDDQILYYTGRLITADGEMDEEECYAPLGDFGMGYAGCVIVKWPGHSGWDCG
jgi:hypothetical protein